MQWQSKDIVNELYVMRACLGVVSDIDSDMKERKKYLSSIESGLKACIDQQKELKKSNSELIDGTIDFTARRQSEIEKRVAENFHSSINPLAYILLLLPITFLFALIYVVKKNKKDEKAKEALRAQMTKEVDAAIENYNQIIKAANEAIKNVDEGIAKANYDIEITKSEIRFLSDISQIYETTLSEKHLMMSANYEYIDWAIYGLQTGKFDSLQKVLGHAVHGLSRSEYDTALLFVSNEIDRMSRSRDSACTALFVECANALNDRINQCNDCDTSSYHDDIMPLLERVTLCTEEKLMDDLYQKKDIPVKQLLCTA